MTKIEHRIMDAASGHDLHAIAAEAGSLTPERRAKLQRLFAERCADLWPRQCGRRKR